MLTLAFNIQPAKAEPRTWIVDDDGPADFRTIQEAINAASPGDTIYVRAGAYYENVDANKSVSLIGEDKYSTIIDGKGVGTVVYVATNNLVICNFTIRNSGNIGHLGDSGIHIVGSNNCFVSNNLVINNGWYGIFIYLGSYNTVSNNFVADNAVGIIFYKSEWNKVANNVVKNSSYKGMTVSSSPNSELKNNLIENNSYGLSVLYGGGVIFQNNIINNIPQMDLSYCYNSIFYHNNFISPENKVELFQSGSNIWDDGYPSGGNYWSDYTGVDANGDGIGDTPYIIDANNRDRYPLMKPFRVGPRTWYVDDDLQDYPDADFTKIQDAVDAAQAGDMIVVYPGTYTENVDVYKSLTIKSENGAEMTIVQAANPDEHVFEVTADYVNISGFTVRGANGHENGAYYCVAGLYLKDANYCNISSNNASNNNIGFILEYSFNNILSNNIASNIHSGVYLGYSSNNTVMKNNASSNEAGYGIKLWHSSNNVVNNNNVNANEDQGIWLYHSSNNLVIGNNVSNNNDGIDLWNSDNNTITNNAINSNSLHGIYLLSSNNNTLIKNIISNNNDGICLTGPSDGSAPSNNNILSNNTVSNNTYYGIGLGAYCRNNTIYRNTIVTNGRGIEFYNDATNNIIYSNNLIGNVQNAYCYPTLTNWWDSQERLTYTYNGKTYTNYLGNYWSDYIGSDADGNGIGDTPYSINSVEDNYPLMEPFENYLFVPPHPTACGKPVLISPLEISPEAPYAVGDTLTAKFTIQNVGDVTITLDKLLVGGRLNDGTLPNGELPDFTFQTVTLQPGQTHQYEGTLELTEAGKYHFFIAYYIENPTEEEKKLLDENNWNTCVDLAEGLTDADRIKDVAVLPALITQDDVDFSALDKLATAWAKYAAVSDPFPFFLQGSLEGYDQKVNIVLMARKPPIEAYRLVRIRTPQVEDSRYLELNMIYESSSTGCYKTLIQNFIMSEYQDWKYEFGEKLFKEVVGFVAGKIIGEPLKPISCILFYMDCVEHGMAVTLRGWTPGEEYMVYLPVGFNLAIKPQRDFTLAPCMYATSPWSSCKDLPGQVQGEWKGMFLMSNNVVDIYVPIRETENFWAKFFKLDSPGELRVYDSYGRVTGLVNGQIREDIPHSRYVENNSIVSIFFPIDSYTAEVKGISTGTYKLEIVSVANGELSTFIATAIPTSPGAVHQYIVDWDALSLGEEGVMVKVDSDGDGTFEKPFTADSELTRDEFMRQVFPVEAFPLWIAGVAVAAIAIVTMAMAVFWRRRRQPSIKKVS
jgi:parallel beta-helix repeat protein